MAKGGRYLAKNKSTGGKKKGRGWKIFFIILAVLVVLLGSAAFMAWRYVNGLFGHIKRAETVYQDISDEDLAYWSTYNPDAFTTPEEPDPEGAGADLPQAQDEQPADDALPETEGDPSEQTPDTSEDAA